MLTAFTLNHRPYPGKSTQTRSRLFEPIGSTAWEKHGSLHHCYVGWSQKIRRSQEISVGEQRMVNVESWRNLRTENLKQKNNALRIHLATHKQQHLLASCGIYQSDGVQTTTCASRPSERRTFFSCISWVALDTEKILALPKATRDKTHLLCTRSYYTVWQLRHKKFVVINIQIKYNC